MDTIFDKTSGTKLYNHDEDIEAQLNDHVEKFGIQPLDAIKNWQTIIRRQPLKKFLLHYELFIKTLNVPGDIAEFGVYRGQGLMTWANLLEARAIGNRTKTVFGFDNWKGFTGFSEQDGIENNGAGKTIGGFNPSFYKEELVNSISIFDQDRFVSWKKRIKLIDGQVEDTVKPFLSENPGIRFSLVHFDMDLYLPTKIALEAIWSRVTPGGIIIFDEYAIPDWPGETEAVDEFIAKHPEVKLETSDWTNAPAAWIVKS
ncbi:MAG: macrocin-O-methyltransferase [Oceanospirillales bacterium TMED59]|nr:MAG: macrocin-O-methyltransferase [Oceanospirillales bacterium TMED59]|tara:strand:- start:817 stop:1590 length:774 start_codon:yes stop_codon:yes gene_type:complete